MPFGTGNPLDTLIHADLHTSIKRVYPSAVTIQAATETKADDESIDEAWVNVPGLVGINGILSPAPPATAKEIRTTELTNVKITHVLELQTYQPAITNQHRVIVTRAEGDVAQIFNISGIKFDSQARGTRIELEEVSH